MCRKKTDFGRVSSRTPLISNWIESKFHLRYGLPRGGDLFGHSARLDRDNHEKFPVLNTHKNSFRAITVDRGTLHYGGLPLVFRRYTLLRRYDFF